MANEAYQLQKGLSSPGSPSFYANPERAVTYLKTLQAASAEAKQGNIEVVFGTVQFTLDNLGQIPANTRLRAFADQLGNNAAGGLALTYADANFFFGRCPSGQAIVLQGMGISIWREAAAITDQELELLARNLYLVVNLRNTPVHVGNPSCWPSVQGARGTGNGNVTVGVRPWDPGAVLLPSEDYTVDVVAARAIQLAGEEGDHYRVQIFHPATRVYDQRVLARI